MNHLNDAIPDTKLKVHRVLHPNFTATTKGNGILVIQHRWCPVDYHFHEQCILELCDLVAEPTVRGKPISLLERGTPGFLQWHCTANQGFEVLGEQRMEGNDDHKKEE